MYSVGPTLITVVGGIIGLAMVAVVVSKNAQTSQVIQGGGTALASVIGAAVAPVANNSQSSSFGSTTGIGGAAQ